MAGNSRVFELLEVMLNAGLTPEEVCRDCPELLPEVRRKWTAFGRVDAEFAELLPPSNTTLDADAIHLTPRPVELPQIPGYRVERVLGSGGMGIVYRAWHLQLNRPVALKMLLAGDYAQPNERERFQHEVEAAAALRHPNIVQIYDVDEVDGHPYFTMEFVEGGSLAEAIRGIPQPARQAAALVEILAEAIHVAHQSRIVHRDLKPANILLTLDRTPKITDFGLARRLDDGAGLTLTGALVGTPSYMAPEQARGDKGAIGPATDVYALGAILYELLTGRPPFRSDSPSTTLQLVANEEPVPPRRLNPQVPRDLQTIGLKCLRKEPHRRYASARAFAEDLRHFQRGEPIQARPVSPAERAVCWVRRRPALAGTLSLGILLASVLAITIVGWRRQREGLSAAAVAYAEADLSESERLRDRGEFEGAAALLERANDRLREFVPPDVSDRISAAFGDLELVARLDAIRMERALVKPPTEVLDVLAAPASSVMPSTTLTQNGKALPEEILSGRHYEEAFRNAGIGAPGDDPAKVAARVRTSTVKAALVAALDDRAACASDRDQRAWVLDVNRKADPNPWRDRVRDPMTWDEPETLRDLADRAPVEEQSPQLLTVLGARLRAMKIDSVELLVRVAATYPGDFWANIETGNAFLHQSNAAQAAGYYRAALALRPGTVSLHYALGAMYLRMGSWDQCIAEYQQAVRLNPADAWCHNRLGVALQWRGGHDREAITRFRDSIRIDPNIGWTHHHLALSLEREGQFDEAVEEFEEAIRLSPEKRAEWKRDLRGVLLRQGRRSEVRADWKEELLARPAAHDDWYGYAELCLFLGDEAEYRHARRDLLKDFGTTTDPYVAERVGRACLLLPGADDEFRQAAALADRAVAAGGEQYDWVRPYFYFVKGLAHYRQGRFDEAIVTLTGDTAGAAEFLGPSPRLVTAMALYQRGLNDAARELLAAAVHSYDWSDDKATTVEAWIARILRREADTLMIHPGRAASSEDTK